MSFLKDVPELHKEPMRDIVYERLRKAIVQGELKPDTFFTDQEIAEEFGVSRMPIREAVQKLEGNGYIERVSMKGNRVCGLSPLELAYCFMIRKAIEPLAVRYTALYVTDAELDEIGEIIHCAEEAIANYKGNKLLERFIPLLKSFNEKIFSPCKSERLIELIWSFREILDRYRVMRINLPDHADLSLLRRKELYKALRAHDPDEAAKIWAIHIEESFSIWREKSGHADDLKGFVSF